MEALDQIDNWPVPKAAVAVVGRDGIVAERGVVERADRWASVSKLFTAYAVLMAAQDGELDLDQPAGPDGSTVRHLLSHASGLPFEGMSPIAPPGTRRIYSNTGFDLLGEAVAKATRFSFDQYMAIQVLEPLEIEAAVVGGPSAGLAGSVLDLAKFAQELVVPVLLSGERLEAATSIAFGGLAGTIPGLGRYDSCDWGLGFELRDDKSPHWTGKTNSPATFGHFGGAGSFLWVDPARQLAMCGLTGRAFEAWALEVWPPLFDAVLDELNSDQPAV